MTFKTSCSENDFNKFLFSSMLTRKGILAKNSTDTSSSEIPSSWSKSWKWFLAACFRLALPVIISPSIVDISEMWFLDNLALHCLWKKAEFLSHAFNHRLWYFSLNASSSCLKSWKEMSWADLSWASWEMVISFSSISKWNCADSETFSFLLLDGVFWGCFIQLFKAILVFLSFYSQMTLGESTT